MIKGQGGLTWFGWVWLGLAEFDGMWLKLGFFDWVWLGLAWRKYSSFYCIKQTIILLLIANTV